ncbi:MAG: DNA mismatch repair endonuclease MutL [Snowella sp.]|nr:DNA mismatch repair endonuclease MutL [Snowella sp.]
MIASLPTELVNLIAAGEVIDSPVAVVRELVENAIDAGASRLIIRLNPEQGWVQVTDNGQGMTLDDLKACALPHTTSKISQRQHLEQITSLGFRGEALHSLSQVSELEIASRSAKLPDSTGWKVRYCYDGQPQEPIDVAIATGTIVTVNQLFQNLPQRRLGLPPLAQQLKAIQTYLQTMALCRPQITWQVWNLDQLWLSISPSQTPQQTFPQILKTVKFNDLQCLSLNLEVPSRPGSTAQLNLVIGLPDRCHRRRPDWVKIAVNQRPVKLPELEQSIIAAFHRTLPRDRFPVCFLHLQVCPSQIDWNRHPAKTEIYLHSLPFWQAQISQAIEQALRLNSDSLSSTHHHQRVTQILKAAEATSPYQVNPPTVQPTPSALSQISLMPLKAVAQVNKTYIVAEHDAGIWLIEQHIAHERVLYEQLQDHWQLVSLEKPIILNHLTLHQVEQLQELGLEVESFGEQVWAVRNAPKRLADREDCLEALIELSLGGDLAAAQAATACRTAIRNGTDLTLREMQTLLDQWKITRHPQTCPHGRPIYLSLEESSLARFFRRHWVIGKSHGI